MGAKDVWTREAIDVELESLPQWRYRQGALTAALKAPSSRAALDLMARIGDLAEAVNHHPDVDWRYNMLFVTLISHDVGGEVTSRDIALAKQISAVAHELGAVAKPALNRSYEIAIDTDDPSAVSETWRVALGYKVGRYGDLVDPYGRGPGLWFQKTSTPNPNRMHVDVHVSMTDVGEALDAVAATEGSSLDHTFAPRWVVVTDAQGNRVCLCTEEGHGPDL
ncbi:4a-hydroxytetrahydrobiopterin dehydratase [Arthrobacter sp. 35W]|uniref:4a-hydroxytetrahydrobiopterin dehydratase n=1 Tax=Arthrobacter sp. 35W TaxID=1132441 RepID=UPI0004255D52|nr:4a-hydroxytetrahydrobiopterin dehydratase [Arthrobacter sp. 35W]